MTKEIAIPLAYFITFTCYGTWLHGERNTSVNKHCNTPGTKFLQEDPIKATLIKAQLNEAPYLLDKSRRNIVLQTIKEACVHRKWSLLAAHVRTNHVHMVIHALVEPKLIMNVIKAYASRNLNGDLRKHRWTRHGSTKYLWNEVAVEAAIRYVIDEQGEALALFENVDRIISVPHLKSAPSRSRLG